MRRLTTGRSLLPTSPLAIPGEWKDVFFDEIPSSGHEYHAEDIPGIAFVFDGRMTCGDYTDLFRKMPSSLVNR
ncbi:hypothetical protein BH09BAC6_BH09BAC6_25420 [soil metagenome]|jgi:hypothetical protein